MTLKSKSLSIEVKNKSIVFVNTKEIHIFTIQIKIMIEIEIEFNLENHPMDDNIKNFWTLPDQKGYNIFKNKANDVLLALQKGNTFEIQNIFNGQNERDILSDFKTNQFLIEDKRGIVNHIKPSQIIIKLKPTILNLD